MGGRIYSIIVEDDLMEKVDRVAYKKGMSRSQIINEMMTEYLNLVTPEYKINQVMEEIAKRIHIMNEIQYVSESKGSSIQCRATVGYKYNPKIRYMLELSGKDMSKMATLKIISRTQNTDFYAHLLKFFKLVEAVEEMDRIGFTRYSIRKSQFRKDGNRIIRDFYYDWMHEDLSIEEISKFLSNYIEMLNHSMNAYFNQLNIGDTEKYKLIKKIYSQYI